MLLRVNQFVTFESPRLRQQTNRLRTQTLLLTTGCSLVVCASRWRCLDIQLGSVGVRQRPVLQSLVVWSHISLCDDTCFLKAGNILTSDLCPAAPQYIESRVTSQQRPQTAAGLGTRLHSAPCLLEGTGGGGGKQKIRKQHSDPVVAPSAGLKTLRPLHSSPRLSELMQRSPLPTILGSPSRVSRHCVCACARE